MSKEQQQVLQCSGRPLDKGVINGELKIEPTPICPLESSRSGKQE